MRIKFLFAAVCCFSSICLFAQNGQVTVNMGENQAQATVQQQQISAKLKVRAALVDKDLNVKPVPKLRLALRAISHASPELIFATNFDGMAEVDAAPGTYELTSQQPIEFQGHRYSWKVNVTLPPEGSTVDLSIDNAQASDAVTLPARKTDELTALFRQLQPSVVTVWSEFGHGTGFIIDSKGLLLTNQHVIGPSEYIAVQFNEHYKVPAILLASDAQADVAVLWVNV
jgi:S1-C subfamily serine protease